MVERSRSVIFEPDGKIVEYELALPEIIAAPVLTQPPIEQENMQETNEAIVIVPIQIQESPVIGRQNANSELSWSSFILIFTVLCIAIYSLRTLMRRLRELQKDFMGFGSQQKTQSLLSDMDDEWRMQKIENEALTRRNIQGSDGDFERFSNQSQITQQTSKRAATEKVWPQKNIFSSFRSQKPTVNDDDEFKRN